MAIMDDITNLAHKAQDLAAQHPDLVKQALHKAEDILDKETGGTHTAQIHSAGDKAQSFLNDQGGRTTQ